MRVGLSGATFLLFSFATGALAQAATVSRVVSDENGMPRCFEYSSPSSAGVILSWDESDVYKRTVLAARLDSRFAAKSASAKGTPLSCENWKNLKNLPNGVGHAIFEGETGFGEIEFDARTLKALTQIRRGGNVFRDEGDATTFLSNHSVDQFTQDTDRDLTARYGAGFASEVYKAWILTRAENTAFRGDVLANMRARTRLSDTDLVRRFTSKKRVVVFVKGLGHELNDAKKFEVLGDQLKAIGIPTILVDTPSFDPIRSNAETIRKALDAPLSQGNNVILISLSKGSPESLFAAASLRARLEGSSRPAGYGKLEAFISLSGVYSPSFIIDWASEFPQWLILRDQLRGDFKASGLAPPSLDGLKDLSVERMNTILAELAQKGVPQETVYVSVVGALSGNGLVPEGYMRQIQDQVLRSSLLPSFGANDGYIEYPGTELPASFAPHRYTLAINSSHAIVDGDIDGISLSTTEGARRLIGALLDSVFERVETK